MDKSTFNIIFDAIPHKYYFEGFVIPSVSELMQNAKISGDYSFMHPKYRERGTYVHKASEMMDLGQFDIKTAPDEYYPFVYAYSKFLEENEVEVHVSEELLFNPKLIYCGTQDRIVTVNGVKYLCDIKTGYYQKWHKVQLTSYNLAMLDSGAIKEPLPIANLYLDKNGNYTFKTYSEELPYVEVLRAAVTIYWYKRERDCSSIKKLVANG